MSTVRRLVALRLIFLPVLGLSVLMACGGPPQTANSSSPRTQSRRGARRTQPVDLADVHLGTLLGEVTEYEGQGRNLFAYGRVERAIAPPPPPIDRPDPAAASRTTTTVPPRQPAAPAASINLKFAGVLEKTLAGGKKQKYAVLLDGTDVLTSAEGDLVKNRYRIVEIGLETVTMSIEGSPRTQRIPLRSN